MAEDGAAGALNGLRVLDLATLFSGPQVATILADFGADVLKVEARDGDPLRRLGVQRHDRSLMWAMVGRSKRTLAVDFDDAGDLDLVQRLTGVADVVVVNQPRRLLERWGCTWEDVSARNPAAVMVSVSCYGSTGPLGDDPGNGSLAEAFAGLTHLTGDPDGPPVLPSVALGDTLVAMAGVVGTLVALHHRISGGGPGQYVDASMYESVLGLLGPPVISWEPGTPPPQRTGSRVAGGVPRNVYGTRDGKWVVVSGTTDAQVARILVVMGHDTPEARARYGRSAARLQVADELDGLVAGWVGRNDRDEVLARLREARVPAAPVNDVADLAVHPQVQARGSLLTVEDPELGPVTLPAPFPQLSATPGRVGWLGPDADTGRDTARRWLGEGAD